MRVLVVNPGSSSLKLRVLGDDDEVLADDDGNLEAFVAAAPDVDAAGVRVVHGGPDLRAPTVVDDGVVEAIAGLADLAPLHNPPAVDAIRAVRRVRPDLPVVACFDTAFHAHLPSWASTYAVPWSWTTDWGIRRYGFHGLSHAWTARRAAELASRPVDGTRTVSCHLGAGASLCAIDSGLSVDTTMGFTPLEGLVMATRAGSVDPGALLHVQRRHGLSAEEVERVLDQESGLLGLSGVSGDVREVQAAADGRDTRAALALAVFVHRLRAGIAAMTASLRGLDVLAFTGGIGEHNPWVRASACSSLAFLGVDLDRARNKTALAGDAVLSPTGAVVTVVAVEAREDVEIARQVRHTAGGLSARTSS